MKEFIAKKLFRGCVSVRDYTVKYCLEKNEDLIVTFSKQKMTLTPNLLKQGTCDGRVHVSKKGSQSYMLIDFPWIPDKTYKEFNPITQTYMITTIIQKSLPI